MEEFEYKEEYQYMSGGCLNLTDDCNLACRYCFVNQHPHYMDLNTAKNGVDFFYKNLKIKQEKYNINYNYSVLTYFGGEPMLMYDKIIVPLTKYIETKYPNTFILNMTTNGTLLNKERINFLKEHNIKILLSIDGAPETQNYNRPCKNGKNSFGLIEKNIPLILEAFPETTFRSTISQEQSNKIFENYVFATYMGFSNVYMTPNARETWSKSNINNMKQQIYLLYNYLLDCFRESRYFSKCTPITDSFINVLNIDLHTINNINKKDILKNDIYRCGLGVNGGSIGYDGKIYGCQEQDSNNVNTIFYIGDIKNGIDVNRHKKLLETYYNRTEHKCANNILCSNCISSNICDGNTCPSRDYEMFNNFGVEPEINCIWKNELIINAARIMKILVKENNQNFKKYLEIIYKEV